MDQPGPGTRLVRAGRDEPRLRQPVLDEYSGTVRVATLAGIYVPTVAQSDMTEVHA